MDREALPQVQFVGAGFQQQRPALGNNADSTRSIHQRVVICGPVYRPRRFVPDVQIRPPFLQQVHPSVLSPLQNRQGIFRFN